MPGSRRLRSYPVALALLALATGCLDDSSSAEFVPMIVGGGTALTMLLTALAVLQTLARQRAEASGKLADERRIKSLGYVRKSNRARLSCPRRWVR